jgi:hypothetical protein
VTTAPIGEPSEPEHGRAGGELSDPWPASLWDGPEPEEPTDAELLGLWPDPFAGAPQDADTWLADLTDPGSQVPSAAGIGFAAGGPLDQMTPNPILAGFAADAFDDGLGRLSDDELMGLLTAARRLSSWQAWMELAAVTELDQRRSESSPRGASRSSEHVSEELAIALTLTSRSADALLTLSRDLARLPVVLRALAAGVIDRPKAAVFAAELAGLDDRHARAIAAALWRPASRMTTGQLRAELRALVLIVDPDAARRRRERGREEARVELWTEGSGNSGIAGRELPAGEVITADKRISAIAAELKRNGAEGTTDQLRAAVFTALLTGTDLARLVPAAAQTDGQDSGDRPAAGHLPAITGTVNLTLPLSSWAGWSQAPAEVPGLGPIDADTGRDLAARLAASPRTRWCLTLVDDDGQAVGHACARQGPRTAPGPAPGKDPPSISEPEPSALATWLSWLTWLSSLRIEWLDHHACTHTTHDQGYRPGARLAHLIRIRQRTCSAPGCRRPAQTCDLDHTIPYDQGGPTCQHNLGPLCRRHHRAKQAPGWSVTQPQPGSFIWTAPHGRTYLAGPDPYQVS